jgi:outer membrane protein insertion porin family
MQKHRPSVLIPAFLVVAAWAVAQSRTTALPNSMKLAEVKVVGSHRFESSEVASALGLKLGERVSEDSLKQGADRLAASGMFSDVTYSYVSRPQGTRAEYHVNDTEKLIPAIFENFVWLPPPDLLRELRKREPLFRDEVPNAGEMYERLADDIKGVLDDLHVAGTVKVLPQVPQAGGEVTGFIYVVDGVKLPIRSTEFPGASSDMNGLLQKVAGSSLLDKDYSVSRVQAITALDLLPQYRMRGFLKAKFGDPLAELHDRVTGAVAVKLPIEEGKQYQLASVRWSGNTTFPASDLTKFLKTPFNKPANQVQLEEDMGAISKIYGTRGYLEARLTPSFSFDDVGQTVTVDVEVREGDQYHMGTVRFEGLPTDAAAKLQKEWKLHLGDVYDTSYPRVFLTGASTHFDFSTLKVQLGQQPNRESKSVDVVFRFAPK